MDLLAAGRIAAARDAAEAWNRRRAGRRAGLCWRWARRGKPAGETAAAARAYGSLIDLFPGRADLRRLAGERLERLGDRGLRSSPSTPTARRVEQRPDHPSGPPPAGLGAAASTASPGRPSRRSRRASSSATRAAGSRGVDQILREDLGLLAAAWLAPEPGRAAASCSERLEARTPRLAGTPSLRFVLTWETDANDVDLHIHDRRGGHAYFSQPELPSGGRLIADVTTGYGPECFAIERAGPPAAPYRLEAHYYRRGPMGYGMGPLQVVRHDGAGRFTVEPRPFVVMADDATVDFGTVEAKVADSKVGK